MAKRKYKDKELRQEDVALGYDEQYSWKKNARGQKVAVVTVTPLPLKKPVQDDPEPPAVPLDPAYVVGQADDYEYNNEATQVDPVVVKKSKV
jgi:hypothetical protein